MAPVKKSANAMQFIFKPEDLQAILEGKPEKVLFTITVEGEVLKSGEKVGVLRINAVGCRKGKKMSLKDPKYPGCPVPPCFG